MIRAAMMLGLLALAGCSDDRRSDGAAVARHSELESAAISAGVIADPASGDISGLYAADTDRVCIVPAAQGFRIGIAIDYGDQQGCAATGSVVRARDSLQIRLRGSSPCEFSARFEGDRIVFPGALPAGCDSRCSGRASLAGVSVVQLSRSVSEASSLRASRGQLVCGDFLTP